MIEAIAFTCYPVTDMERARRFYEEVLGLKPSEGFGGGRWQEYDLQNGTFTLGVMGDDMPECFKGSRGTSIAFEVDDLDAMVAKARKHDVPVKLEPIETPVCHMAVITDPDDNVVMLHQLKQKP